MFPHPEDDGGVQARLVRDQRGLVSLPVFPTKQVSGACRARYSHAQPPLPGKERSAPAGVLFAAVRPLFGSHRGSCCLLHVRPSPSLLFQTVLLTVASQLWLLSLFVSFCPPPQLSMPLNATPEKNGSVLPSLFDSTPCVPTAT